MPRLLCKQFIIILLLCSSYLKFAETQQDFDLDEISDWGNSDIRNPKAFDPDLGDGGTVVQSKLCTRTELETGIQCMKEFPRPVYEVMEGDNVIMNCVISNLKGRVQWRARLVLLGYDRLLPGWPRYRMVGNQQEGESNLQIRNVNVSDEGEYECQVTPTKQQPLLRRKTRLTVLVKPSKPQIIYEDSSPSNSQIVLREPNSMSRVELACISEGGRPAPTFEWQHNGQLFQSTNRVHIYKHDSGRSGLSLSNGVLKDGDRVACLVSNKATERESLVERVRLETIVRIVVHRPPGQPQIIEFKPKATYTEGSQLSASCVASPPGKPAGTLRWKWYLPNNKTEEVPPRYYTVDNDGRRLINRLLIPTIRRKYHWARLVCEAAHDIGPLQSTSITIKVKYTPANVSISSNDNSLRWSRPSPNGHQSDAAPGSTSELVVYGRSGESKNLKCVTSPYYDYARVEWYSIDNVNGNRMKIESRDRVINHEKLMTFQTETNISVLIERGDAGRYLKCVAFSQNGETVAMSKVRLDIVYPPDRPIIMGYQSNQPIPYQQVLELSCKSDGGNPLPELYWYKDNKVVNSAPMITEGQIRSRKLKLYPTKEDNGAKLYCNATSPALQSGVISNEVTLNVLFPSSKVKIFNNGPAIVPAGQSLELICEAGSANPASHITWRHHDCGIRRSMLSMNVHDCSIGEIRGVMERPSFGSNGGSRSRNRLTFRTDWRDNGDYIECQAGNSVTSPRARIPLNITFSPQFHDVRDGQHLIIKEGESREFSLSPVANPRVTKYTWLRNGRNLQATNFLEVWNDVLKLTNVRVEDMANYTLIAANTEGENRVTVFLNVTYGPQLDGKPHDNKTVTTQNAELKCRAKANPATASVSFSWQRLQPAAGADDITGEPMVEGPAIKCNGGVRQDPDFKLFVKCRRDSPQSMSSSLMVYNVAPSDLGEYRCTINNGVGRSVAKIINLIVHSRPQIVHVPRYAKGAGELGQTITLNCYSKGEPKPSFQWFRGPTNHTLVAGDKFKLNEYPVRIGMYRGELKVMNTQLTDYGQYYCQASNDKGLSVIGIEVTRTSKPDPPTQLRLINATPESLKIAWTPGFNGGLPQVYQVRWKPEFGIGRYSYEKIQHEGSPHTVYYIIQGLKSGTSYSISVSSSNGKHGMSSYSHELKANTLTTHLPPDTSKAANPNTVAPDDNALLIIVAACVFGFVVLVINILVIAFFVKRRGGVCHKRPKANNNAGYVKADTVEMYPRMNGCARGMSEDQKTYSSYDTASEDLKEDILLKHNEYAPGVLANILQMGALSTHHSSGPNSEHGVPSQVPIGLLRNGTTSPMTGAGLLHSPLDQQLLPMAVSLTSSHHRSGTSSPAGSLHSQHSSQQPNHHQHQQQLAMAAAAYYGNTAAGGQMAVSGMSGQAPAPLSPVPPYLLGPVTTGLTPICETGGAGSPVNCISGGAVTSLPMFVPGQSSMYYQPTPPHTPQRCSPLMTGSFHRNPVHHLNTADIDLVMHNSYAAGGSVNDTVAYNDGPRSSFVSTFNPDGHPLQRHSYAEELRRIQYGGQPMHHQFSYPGNSLPRFSGLAAHHMHHHHRNMSGAPASPDLFANVVPTSRPDRPNSRSSIDHMDVIPPPQDFSPSTTRGQFLPAHHHPLQGASLNSHLILANHMMHPASQAINGSNPLNNPLAMNGFPQPPSNKDTSGSVDAQNFQSEVNSTQLEENKDQPASKPKEDKSLANDKKTMQKMIAQEGCIV